MNCKIFFKSHFKLNSVSKRRRKIFLKNIIINLFFLKFLLLNCTITLNFFKNNTNIINILKAPSRHKKFIHQYLVEFFLIQLTIISNVQKLLYNINHCDVLVYNKNIIQLYSTIVTSLLVQTKIKVYYRVSTKHLFLSKILL